jgi:hypothetical protein
MPGAPLENQWIEQALGDQSKRMNNPGQESPMPKSRPDDEKRCFRCGRLVAAEFVRVLDADCPTVFKGKSLSVSCVEVVKGHTGSGMWARERVTVSA